MKILKTIMTPLLIALAMGTFTACSDSSSNSNDADTQTDSYIINATENRDIPIDSEILALSEDTKVKITRDVENDATINVYVLTGSVEVFDGE